MISKETIAEMKKDERGRQSILGVTMHCRKPV